MDHPLTSGRDRKVPAWVPAAAKNYIAHTEDGLSIRELARATSCHPSTILRQVRRFEGRRDDPLVDDALRTLAQQGRSLEISRDKGTKAMNSSVRKIEHSDDNLSQDRIDQEARRILRRLCETGAVLAVAMEMETAVVVREEPDGTTMRTAVVDREIAQAMALKDWISCPEPTGRINRYFVTNGGRAALRRLTAVAENKAQGFAEKRSEFEPDESNWSFVKDATDQRPNSRYYVTESPLLGLARRRDRDGTPFLAKDLVAAGERLREDFEISLLGPKMPQTWEGYIALPDGAGTEGAEAALRARSRVRQALADLGPGLGHVVLQCCCLLDGLEATEKALGWSARSGKIVLRIALHRLRRHFEETQGKYGPMIG